MSLLRRAQTLFDEIAAAPDRSAAGAFRRATADLSSAAAYDGLHPRSLAIASAKTTRTAAAVNLVLPQLAVSAIFAGARTAIEFGLALGERLQLPIRLIGLTGTLTAKRRKALQHYLASAFGVRASTISSIWSAVDLPTHAAGVDDVWIATHWTTAHSLDVAARLGVLDRRQIVYLVQDYEPGFLPWSTEYALARSTYHAGFKLVVNSAPLRNYLASAEQIDVAAEHTFRPQLDLARLKGAARARRSNSGTTSVLFYARPDKPRNMFALGMSALALLAIDEDKHGRRLVFRTVGARHSRPSNGPLSDIQILGRLDWAAYFGALAKSDVLLSLQYSPHPSHPPLDAVVSGGYAVTNELNGTRADIHPRLRASDPTPTDLSATLGGAVREVRASDRGAEYSETILESLGDPFALVMDRLANEMTS